MARIYSDILSGTMDVFASVISNNLNVINGIEDHPYGMLYIILGAVALAFTRYCLFGRRRWI